jgi:hypothetical protein
MVYYLQIFDKETIHHNPGDIYVYRIEDKDSTVRNNIDELLKTPVNKLSDYLDKSDHFDKVLSFLKNLKEQGIYPTIHTKLEQYLAKNSYKYKKYLAKKKFNL